MNNEKSSVSKEGALREFTDEDSILTEVAAIKLCYTLLQARGANYPQALKNTVLLATSFAGYKKWDKVITYTKQSRKHCETADSDLYNLCLSLEQARKIGEELEELEVSFKKENSFSEIEGYLNAGDYHGASEKLTVLKSEIKEIIKREWMVFVEDTEDMASICREDKLNTDAAERSIADAQALFTNGKYEEAFLELVKARKRLRWIRELKFKTGISITEETEEDSKKKEEARAVREKAAKERYAEVMARINGIEKRIEKGLSQPAMVEQVEKELKLVKYLIQGRDGNPRVEDIPYNAQPELKAVRCFLCQGGIKSGLLSVECKCGRKFHESCAARSSICPKCESLLIEKSISPYDVAEKRLNELEKQIEEYESRKEKDVGKSEAVIEEEDKTLTSTLPPISSQQEVKDSELTMGEEFHVEEAEKKKELLIEEEKEDKKEKGGEEKKEEEGGEEEIEERLEKDVEESLPPPPEDVKDVRDVKEASPVDNETIVEPLTFSSTPLAAEPPSTYDRGFVNGVSLTSAGPPLTSKGIIVKKQEKVTGTRRTCFRKIRRRKRRSIVPQAVVLTLACLILLTAVFTIWYISKPERGIQIDGRTDDWAGLTVFKDTILDTHAGIDIEEYSVYQDNGGLYFYLKTRDEIFKGVDNGWDVLRVFVDTDRNNVTGYRFEQLGADAMVLIGGYDWNIVSSAVYVFNSSAGGSASGSTLDWSCWEYRGGASAVCRGSIVEGYGAGVGRAGVSPVCHFVLSHYSVSGDREYENRGMAYADSEKGCLVIEQRYMGGDIVSTGLDVLELKLYAKGKPVRVENLTVPETDFTLTQNQIEVDKEVVIRCSVKGGLVAGKVYNFEVKEVLTAAGVPYRVIGTGGRAYFNSVPEGIVIDGAFEDWRSIDKGTDIVDKELGNITADADLREYASVLKTEDNSEAYFYMSVSGDILAGADIPVHDKRPVITEGSSGTVIKRENTGCDYARVYVDIGNTTGGQFRPEMIKEGYLIEISGRDGRVVASKIWDIRDGARYAEILTGNIKYGLSRGQIEIGINANVLAGLAEDSIVYFEMTDWRGFSDSADSPLHFQRLSSSGSGNSRGTPHAPIFINGDIDFTAQAVTEGWPGDGTEGNPYIIENYDINAGGGAYCIRIENITGIYFIIQNCNLNGATQTAAFPYGAGIAFKNVSHATLKFNNLTGNRNGTYLYNSSWNFIDSNNASGNSQSGIYLYSSTNNTLINNLISGNAFGIYLSISSNSNNIVYNNILNNTNYGIFLAAASYNNITSNNASGNNYGLYMSALSNYNNLTGNNASRNSNLGFYLSSSSYNTVTGNIASNNIYYGIFLSSSHYNNLSNNEIHGNNYLNIYLSTSNNNTITSNNIYGKSDYGISLTSTSNNNITSNNIYNNICGVYIGTSNSITLRENTFLNNGIVVWGNNALNWNTHTIDITNMVNEKPVYYYTNQTSGVVPQDAGQVILANCTNILASDLNISNATCGVQIGFSTNNTLRNCILLGNSWYGVLLMNSDSNSILLNNLTANYDGIYMLSSNYNNITNNIISNNMESIYMDGAHYNNITSNTIIDNGVGIMLWNSNNNFLSQNNVIKNYHGVSISYGSSNILRENTFVSNYDASVYLENSNNNELLNNTIINTTNLVGGIRVDTGIYKVVYIAFGFEAINTSAMRDTVLSRTITWLCPGLSSKILLVDDDRGNNYEIYYNASLNSLGILYDYWNTMTNGTPDYPDLAPYPVVIWFTGDDWHYTMEKDEQASLEQYLDNGGNLFLTGQDIGYYLIADGNDDGVFYYNYIHARYVTDDMDFYLLSGNDGDPVGGGLNISIAGGDGADNQDYPSGILPVNGAETVFVYSTPSAGIFIKQSNNNNITGNNISNNKCSGIQFIDSSSFNIISYNIFYHNLGYGINITSSSSSNTIRHNDFVQNNNGGCQAYDEAGGNDWNLTLPQEGNYWDNWDGLDWGTASAYPIDGSTGASDWYPLGAPVVIPEFPATGSGCIVIVFVIFSLFFCKRKKAFPKLKEKRK
ncbi:MAG: NosD domain-containing protein [Thermoplasmata archaeon]